MNKGIAKATGDYVLFLNSADVLYDENVIKKVCPLLNGSSFYYGTMEVMNKPSTYWVSPYFLPKNTLLTIGLPHQATFIRLDLLKKRPYREDLKLVSDWEQMFYEFNILGNRDFKRIPVIVTKFDTNGLSTVGKEKGLQEINLVLKEYFGDKDVHALFAENRCKAIGLKVLNLLAYLLILPHLPFSYIKQKLISKVKR